MERNTKQRDAIRQVFEVTPRPLGPTEVLEAGREQMTTLGIATVYRTINALVCFIDITEQRIDGALIREQIIG